MTLAEQTQKSGLWMCTTSCLISVCIPTKAERPADEVIRTVAETALSILDKNGIAMEQCVGVGIGVPGTVDRKKGIVRYSNNIRWEDVPLVKEMSTYLPIPVEIANDADCAALGETIAGAGKECSDVVMITTGNRCWRRSRSGWRDLWRAEESEEVNWVIW